MATAKYHVADRVEDAETGSTGMASDELFENPHAYFKQVRKRMRLSQEKFAELLHVSHRTIMRYENRQVKVSLRSMMALYELERSKT